MKKAAFVFIFCFSVVFNGYSQTKQELIKELFHLMQPDSLMDKTFKSMIPAMLKQMQSQLKDSVSLTKANELMTYTKGVVKNIISEDMVMIYDKYFDGSEIKDFIAFYKTPSGQKLIHVQPDIQKEMTTIMVQKYIPEIIKTLKAKTEELKDAEKNKNQGQQ